MTADARGAGAAAAAVADAGRTRSVARALSRRPHLVLAVVATLVLLCELATRETGSSFWMIVAALLAGGGFLLVWMAQDRLRLRQLLLVTFFFHVAWIGVHLHVDLTSLDSSDLYRVWGNELLDGRYPESQYPPGAVLLFALDAWLGGGATRTSHSLVMVPFQLVAVAAVWGLRTHLTPWLAALVALWPMNAFFWEFRFDLVPTAFLALGLLAAFRERWGLSGALLGLGAAVKWMPAVAFGLLAVWLLASGRRSASATHALAFLAVFGLLHLPFLVWSPGEATYAYRYFSDQGLTGESVWYVLLAPLGQASVDMQAFWLPADVPGWADPVAIALQALAMVALLALAVRVRGDARAGIALAALGPATFLLTNRVFSPQYLVLILAAWAIAGALALRTRREQLALGVFAMAATTANAFVYPYTLFQHGLWRAASAALFVLGVATTGWLAWRAGSEGLLRARRARSG